MRIPTVQVQTQAVQTVVFLMIVLLVILVSSDYRSEKRFFFSGEIVAYVAGAEWGRRRKSALLLPPLSLSFSPIMRLLRRLTVSRRKWTILDPTATRLKMSLTISAGRTKNLKFVIGWQKMSAHSILVRPGWWHPRWRALRKEKQNKNGVYSGCLKNPNSKY